MPDITMCKEKCPLSKNCYRHGDSGTEPSYYRQPYWLGLDKVGEDCNYYWPLDKEWSLKIPDIIKERR